MEFISVVHSCLYFKFHGKRYLFGLTHSLAQDALHSQKLTLSHIILPSQPYIPSLSLFLWHTAALAALPCRSLVVADLSTKKRVEALLDESNQKSDLKWDFIQAHELKEDYLLSVLVAQAVPAALRIQPNGMGYNDRLNRLNIIVGEKGHSLLLINGCSVVLIDPAQAIELMLQHYGIPLGSLKAIFLTEASNLNIFECLVKLPKVAVIAQEAVYLRMKRQLARCFFWSEKMLRRRVSGKVVEGERRHRLGNLEWALHRGMDQAVEYWEIWFGLKLLRIYPWVLKHVPHDLCSNLQLQFCVLYDLQEPVRSQLHKLPEVYRKKIILNRVTRKHNHQYFAQFSPHSPLLSFQADPHANSQLQSDPLALQLHRRDINAQLTAMQLQNGQLFNSANRVVYVVSGYVVDQEGLTHAIGSRVAGKQELKCYKRATILYEPESNLYFYEHAASLLRKDKQKLQNLLLKVKENSFVAALSKKSYSSFQLTSSTPAEEQQCEQGSQWDLVNQASTLKTLEGGSSELAGSKCLYIVVKGVLKLSNGEKLCCKGMGVSKIRSFLDSQLDEGEEIEVVKDSWVIEIGWQQLQEGLFSAYPQKLYDLLSKTMIFS